MNILDLSKDTHRFAYEMIMAYAKHSPMDEGYILDHRNIPDFDMAALAHFIYRDEHALAYEAVGPDNEAYATRMLPALMQYLGNTNQDHLFEFVSEWREGMVGYVQKIINELLESKLREYNMDKSA